MSQQRVAALRDLAETKKQQFYSRFLDTVRPVLVEHKRTRDNMLNGFTDNYIPVVFPGDDTLMGTIIPVYLEQLDNNTVLGKRVEE